MKYPVDAESCMVLTAYETHLDSVRTSAKYMTLYKELMGDGSGLAELKRSASSPSNLTFKVAQHDSFVLCNLTPHDSYVAIHKEVYEDERRRADDETRTERIKTDHTIQKEYLNVPLLRHKGKTHVREVKSAADLQLLLKGQVSMRRVPSLKSFSSLALTSISKKRDEMIDKTTPIERIPRNGREEYINGKEGREGYINGKEGYRNSIIRRMGTLIAAVQRQIGTKMTLTYCTYIFEGRGFRKAVMRQMGGLVKIVQRRIGIRLSIRYCASILVMLVAVLARLRYHSVVKRS